MGLEFIKDIEYFVFDDAIFFHFDGTVYQALPSDKTLFHTLRWSDPCRPHVQTNLRS